MLVRQRVIATDLMTIGKRHHRDDPVIPRPETGQAVDPPEAAVFFPLPNLPSPSRTAYSRSPAIPRSSMRTCPHCSPSMDLTGYRHSSATTPTTARVPASSRPGTRMLIPPSPAVSPHEVPLRQDHRTAAPSRGRPHSRPQRTAAIDNDWSGHLAPASSTVGCRCAVAPASDRASRWPSADRAR